MGSLCLWTVLLALAVLDTSVSTAASECPCQHTSSAAGPLLVLGIITGASVPLPRPALLTAGACVDLFLCPLVAETCRASLAP